jgi:hypothetical protein
LRLTIYDERIRIKTSRTAIWGPSFHRAGSFLEDVMQLALIDWLAIGAYFLFNILIGLYYRKRATASTEDYFIGGRKVSWWLAGTSMVATTFAADTPAL